MSWQACLLLALNVINAADGVRLLSPSPDKDCEELPQPPHYDYAKYVSKDYTANYFTSVAAFASMLPFGNYTSLVPFLQKLHAGEEVHVAVLGGSEPAGGSCQQDGPSGLISGKACSWPARLVHWLRIAFPQSKVALHNFAQGGTTTSVILAGLALVLKSLEKAPDVILLDTLTNDCTEATTWPSARFSKQSGLSAGDIVSSSYEALLLHLHEMLPSSVVFSFIAGCKYCIPAREHQRKIADHYQVPGIDWAELSASNPSANLWDTPRGQETSSHPTWRTHQQIADTIAMTLINVWHKGCRYRTRLASGMRYPPTTVWPTTKLNLFPACSMPLSSFQTIHIKNSSQGVPSMKGDWRLYEDRPGKPGWIAEVPGSIIDFPLRFGQSPRFAVTWLRSYEGLGKARLSMNGHNKFVLDGIWPHNYLDHVSQSYSMWFQADTSNDQSGDEGNPEGVCNGFDIGPNSNHTLSVEILDAPDRPAHKMKLISVLSC
eukprot:gnl/TRDRNA2_/TRDRNA2_162953_c0_seq1.p1 gnl/TRDRNA2_/TRDRNA2_162953_c0~~gnl/TRDRNA2_/TRDRNA2_162953_c0_seq1.p1  ORF type:complete len:489 (+),score=36.85 gnl/TRDRNA2_/TRDRNA2_162953_c0_seq1:103-1569(+)